MKNSLDKFAELVNIILRSTKSNLINLSNEIKMAELYLELQYLRFNQNIKSQINTHKLTEDELENILVPPMILQPIIENSFKHGFQNNSKINEIILNFSIEKNDFLICEISDNGNGITNKKNDKKSTSSGISLLNINERLQLINSENKKENLIFIENLSNEFNTLVGTKVTLKVPLISF